MIKRPHLTLPHLLTLPVISVCLSSTFLPVTPIASNVSPGLTTSPPFTPFSPEPNLTPNVSFDHFKRRRGTFSVPAGDSFSSPGDRGSR